MSETLLPCPFCGKAPKCTSALSEEGAVSICFECPDGCSVSKDKPTYDEAVAIWNTRRADAPRSRDALAMLSIDDEGNRDTCLKSVLIAGFTGLKWALPIQAAEEMIDAINGHGSDGYAPRLMAILQKVVAEHDDFVSSMGDHFEGDPLTDISEEARSLLEEIEAAPPVRSAASTVEPVADAGLLAGKYPLPIEHYQRVARNLANLWSNGNENARTCILAELLRAAAPTTSPEPATCKESLQVRSSPEPTPFICPKCGTRGTTDGNASTVHHINGPFASPAQALPQTLQDPEKLANASPDANAVREQIARIVRQAMHDNPTQGSFGDRAQARSIIADQAADAIAALSAPVDGATPPDWKQDQAETSRLPRKERGTHA